MTSEVYSHLGRGRQSGAGAGVAVLFIAGYGRSGSTLFERVLAKDPTFVSLGQVKHLWLQGYLQDFLCGCGVPFSQCPFWSEVDREAFKGLDAAAARRLFETRKEHYRPARLPAVLVHERLGRARREPDVVAYGDGLRAVYQAAVAVSGASVVIDSSKDPMHGLILARLPGVSLHVVHLIRDARGVAFSLQRPKVRHQVHWKQQRMPVETPTRTALVWSYRNALAASLNRLATSYRLVRYEDFIASPDEIVEAVRSDLGLGGLSSSVLKDGKVTLPTTHSVSGNANRFEPSTVRLRVDDEWRRALPRADRVRVTALAAPLLLRYGYLLGGGAPAEEA